MTTVLFSAALFVANGMVAWLNLAAFHTSREARDFVAAVAWAGSTAWWLLRCVTAVLGVEA